MEISDFTCNQFPRVLQVQNMPNFLIWKLGRFQPSKIAENHKNRNSEPLNVLISRKKSA